MHLFQKMPPYARVPPHSIRNNSRKSPMAKRRYNAPSIATKLQILNKEKTLLAAVCELKLNLQSTGANNVKALRILQNIRQQTPTALMLKKQPDVVETIKRVRQYVDNGNVYVQKLRDSKRAQNVANIRNLADDIYQQYEKMFPVSSLTMQSVPFWTTFSMEVERFRAKCKLLNLNADEVVALTEEPDEPEEPKEPSENTKSNLIVNSVDDLKSKLKELVDRNEFLATEVENSKGKLKRRHVEVRTMYLEHINDMVCKNNKEIEEVKRQLADKQTK